MVGGNAVAVPTACDDGQPLIEMDATSGGVLCSGLFPHDLLSAKVAASDDRSDT